MSKPKVSFTFPYRWLNDPEDRKYLGDNLIRQINNGGLKQIFQGSPTDTYFAQFGQVFVPAYSIVLKYHCYQPVKIKLTQKQLELYLKDVFPGSRLVSFQTFFVQTYDPSALPVMEMEIFY